MIEYFEYKKGLNICASKRCYSESLWLNVRSLALCFVTAPCLTLGQDRTVVNTRLVDALWQGYNTSMADQPSSAQVFD